MILSFLLPIQFRRESKRYGYLKEIEEDWSERSER